MRVLSSTMRWITCVRIENHVVSLYGTNETASSSHFQERHAPEADVDSSGGESERGDDAVGG